MNVVGVPPQDTHVWETVVPINMFRIITVIYVAKKYSENQIITAPSALKNWKEKTMYKDVIKVLNDQIQRRENEEAAAELYKDKQYNYGFQHGLKFAIHVIEEDMDDAK